MKIKIKQTIYLSTSVIVGTVALAIGLSFIPVKDKPIPKNNDYQDKKPEPNNDEPIIDPKKPDDPNSGILPNVPKAKSANFIDANNKISYVALGDSISAGFDGQMDKDYQGELVDGSLEGLSFPTYLAHLIQKQEKDKLAAFKNFARTGSTFNDWNKLLQEDYSSLTSEEIARLKQYFGDDYEAFKNEVVAKLKQANLVTITLGANDIFDLISEELSKISLFDFAQQIISKQYNYSQIVDLINTTFGSLFNQIQTRQITFIQKLKTINSKANINFIGYPQPLAFISSLIDQNMLNSTSEEALMSISSIFLDLLNNKSKYLAKSNQVFFINPYERNYWNKNFELLTPLLFDIHPSSFGYKKMAMDVFSKLILNSSNVDELNKNNINWSAKYISSDHDSFLKQIDFKDDPFKVISSLFGNDWNKFLTTEDEFFLKHKNEKNENNYFKRVLSTKAFSNLIFDNFLKTFLESDFYQVFDQGQALKKFLYDNEQANLKSLKTWFDEHNFIGKLLLDVQKEFYKNSYKTVKDKKVYDFSSLLKIFKQEINKESRIVSFITSFFNSDLIKTKKNDLKTLIDQITSNLSTSLLDEQKIKNLLKDVHKKYLSKYLDFDDLLNVLKAFFGDANFKKATSSLFKDMLDSSEKYGAAESYANLWDVFKTNAENKKNLKQVLDSTSNLLINNDSFKKVVAKLATKKVLENKELSKNITETELEKLFKDALEKAQDIENEFKLVDKFINTFVDDLFSLNSPKEYKIINSLNKFTQELNGIFSSENLEKNSIKIFKILTSSSILNNESAIFKLLINGLSIAKKQNNISQKVWDNLPEKVKNYLEKYISVEDFSKLIDQTIECDSFSKLIELVVKTLAQNKDNFANADSFYDLFKIASQSTQWKDDFAPSIEQIIKDLLSNEATKKLITNLFNENTKPYGIDPESEGNKKLLNDIFENVHSLIKELGILPLITNTIAENASKYNSFKDFGAELGSIVIQKISENLKNYSWFKAVFSNGIISRNKETIKEDILKVLEGITSNDELIKKFAKDFGLYKTFKTISESEDEINKLLSTGLKSSHLKKIFSEIFEEVLENNAKYGALNNLGEAISTIFSSSKINGIEDDVKNWIKEIFSKNDVLANFVAKQLVTALKNANFAVTDADVQTSEKFVKSLILALIDSKVAKDIFEEAVNALKKANTYLLEELGTKLLEGIKFGGLKFISTADGKKIKLKKIFDNINTFDEIFQKLDANAYANFLNLLFRAAPQNENEGLYKIMFHSDSSDKVDTSGGIADVFKGKIREIIKTFVKPLTKNYLMELASNSQVYTSENEFRKNSPAYQALWRMFSFIGASVHAAVPGIVFWNDYTKDLKGDIVDAYNQTLSAQKSEYLDKIVKKYNSEAKLRIVGFENTSLAQIKYFWSGTQILHFKNWLGQKYTKNSLDTGLSATKYGRDYVLNYIYYHDKKDTKYNKTKTFRQVLIEDLHNGYMPVESN